MVWLRYLLSLVLQQWVQIWGLKWHQWKASSMIQEIFSYIDIYGIATWPINSSAVRFPPVCPWMATRIHAILETSSCCFLHKCVEVREFWPSGLLKSSHQFGIHRFPMNSVVSFSFILIRKTYQSYDQFWGVGLLRVSFDRLVGKNVMSFHFLPPKGFNFFFKQYSGFVGLSNCVA